LGPAIKHDLSTLPSAFERRVSPILYNLLLGIFFGSIGYSIPFLSLFSPSNIWKGVVYALLMIIGKPICGAWIWIWPMEKTWLRERFRRSRWGGILLGSAMVARGEIGLL
jgi:Kef-type K+ transport system membrane component KefB